MNNSLDAKLIPTVFQLGLPMRKFFPIFSTHGERPLAYLDTAASSQKSSFVIQRMMDFLSYEHANIHRGAYALSAQATDNYEWARMKVGRFINAPNLDGVIFTRGTTESINLAAHAFENQFKSGDTLLLTLLEHHSNIVPWQLLAKRKKLKLEYVDINDCGVLDLEDLRAKLKKFKPKLLAVTHIANSLGSVVPLVEVVREAHSAGARVLVDAAQSAAHYEIDVQALDLDFLAFSGHKFYGPTGIGILYVKSDALQLMEPFLGGGDMIETVSTAGSTWAEPPSKFEAGTPPIAEAIALGTAVEFLEAVGLKNIQQHEEQLFSKAHKLLSQEEGVIIYGPSRGGGKQSSIIAFNLERVHAHDLSTVADSYNVQFRSGHHCAMPTLKRLNLQSTARISFGVYSAEQDLDQLIEALRRAKQMFW